MTAPTVEERIRRSLPVLAVGVAAAFAARRLDDVDTWWHLASGRWIVRHLSVPHTDVLSYTVSDHDWTNLQWLYDVVLFGLFRTGGADLLVIALVVSIALAIAVLVVNLRRSLGPLAATALALFAVVTVNERFLLRPEMVTFVLLELVLLIVGSARATQGRRLWLLVPLMVLWVNVHALFVLGVAVIAATAVSALVAETGLLPRRWANASRLDPPLRRRLLVWSAGAVVATLVNPYFLRGVLFPLELLSTLRGPGSPFGVIGEFRPPWSGYFPTFSIGAYQGYFIAAIVLVVSAGLTEALAPRHARRPEGFELGGLLVFVGFAWLSLLARRNIGIFVLGTAPFVARCIAVLADAAPGRLHVVGRRLVAPATAALPVVAGALVWLVVSNGWFAHGGETHEFGLGVMEGTFPTRAAEFAREQRLRGRVYSDLSAGGYLTWANPTGDGVYVDGRLEVYGTGAFTRYLRSLQDARVWREEVERYDIHTVLLYHRWASRHAIIARLEQDPEWAMVYHDEAAVVYAKLASGEALVRAARAAFPAALEETMRRLSAPVRSWQWPVARYTALTSYARLMQTLGAAQMPDAWQSSAALYEMVLRFRAPPPVEVSARVPLAQYLIHVGRAGEAQVHLDRALELDPHNAAARQLQETLSRIPLSAPREKHVRP